MERKCYACQDRKPLEAFEKDSAKKDGRRYLCKECGKIRARERHLRISYNLSEEDVQEIKHTQGGRCKLCNRKRKLCIDHDHESGRVRGLLCYRCNRSLGCLGIPKRATACSILFTR